ncbi:MAG: HEAT repeat domain-containing protein [Candidatus Latescibacterota bacterium]|nr:HEAT repeat domain-containing protein [Candidatus Latescibacterota bacterium]
MQLLRSCLLWALPWFLGFVGCSPDPAYHIEKLKSLDSGVRTKAANELIRFDADEVVPMLLSESSSAYTRVRFEVVWLLGRFRDQRGIPFLINALGDRSPNVAARAALALGLMRSVEALPHLLGYVRDPSEVTRQYVLSALGPCHSYEKAPALSDSAHKVVLLALEDAKPKWRMAALQSLREFGYKGGFKPVLRMAEDPSSEVRHVAIQALGQMASGKHVKSAGADSIVSLTVAQRQSVVGVLLESLSVDELQSIRTKAVRALALIGDEQAEDFIEKLFEGGTKEDKIEARRALAKLR